MVQRVPRKRGLLVGALGLFAALWGAVWVGYLEFRSNAGAPVGPMDAARPANAEFVATPRGVDGLAQASDATSAASVSESSEGSTRSAPPTTQFEDALWFRGRVELPPDAPLEDGLTVIAIEGRGRASPDGPLIAQVARESNRFPVEPDGTFRVAFRPGQGSAYVQLEARWLALDYRRPVRLDEPDKEIILRPELRAVVRGIVRPLPDDPPLPAAALKGELRTSFTRGGVGYDPRNAEFVVGEPFECVCLKPGQRITARIEVPAYRPLVLELDPLAPGELREVEFRPEPGAWIHGRVRDVRGAPLAGVELDLWGEGAGLESALFTQTDAEGRFNFFAAPPGVETTVRVRSTGFLPSEPLRVPALAVRERSLELELVLDPGAVLAGRVTTKDGAPAAGAQVRAEPLTGHAGRPRAPARSTECDDDGRFRLLTLTPVAHSVSVEWRRAKAPIAKGALESTTPREDLELVVEPTFELLGSVRDDRGTPLKKFDVRAEPQKRGAGNARTLRADPEPSTDGAYRVEGLTEGSWSLEVRVDGHEPPAPRVLELPRDAGVHDFLVVRHAQLSGLAVDVDGAPIADVSVRTTPKANAKPSRTSRKTDAQGEFRELSAPAGVVSIQVDAPWRLEQALELQLAPGEQRVLRLVVVKR
jgi:hypothetical protein